MTARVTMADVAARAGVSIATVSHVLAGSRGQTGTIRVSSGTRSRVERAARALHYVPSSAARGLALGTSGRVAIVVPNLHQPYFAQLVEALAAELETAGVVSTVRLSPDPVSERDAVLGRTTDDVDGVIVCPHGLTDELLADERPPSPVVQVGGGTTHILDHVIMDEYEGSLTVARHLLLTGRRRIAFVADAFQQTMASHRFRAYRTALDEAGIPFDPLLSTAGADWDRRESGIEAMVGLLRTGIEFDAAMCVNDAVAVGALRALRRTGVAVPDDVAVTGFDCTEEGAFTTPPLTTVDPDISGMARIGTAMLMERMDGLRGDARAVTVPTRLVVRRSTDPTSPRDATAAR